MIAANSGTVSPTPIAPVQASPSSRTTPTPADSQALTAEQREEAITRAGELMEKRYAAFARTGNFADLGDAHAALLLMKKLIAGRDRDTVLRMEIGRGLI